MNVHAAMPLSLEAGSKEAASCQVLKNSPLQISKSSKTFTASPNHEFPNSFCQTSVSASGNSCFTAT